MTRRFIVGVPARDDNFYGRERQIQAVLALDWTWVCAQRRVGKTSLLLEVERRVNAAGGLGLFFDLSMLRESSTPEELFRDFYELCCDDHEDEFEALGLGMDAFEGVAPDRAFGRLATRLTTGGRQVYFLWDEAERLIGVEERDPGFFERLRGRLLRVPNLRLVLASTQLLTRMLRVEGTVSSFLATFSWLPLGGLDDDDARALFTAARCGGWRTPIPPAITDHAVAWTGGHSLMLQELGARVGTACDYDGARVTEALLARYEDEIAASDTIRQIMVDDFRKLTALQQRILRLLCAADGGERSEEALALAAGVQTARVETARVETARVETARVQTKDVHDACCGLRAFGYVAGEADAVRLRYRFYERFLPPDEVEAAVDAGELRRALSRRSVFLSYSHRDGAYLERLRTHLEALRLGGELEVWDDSRIRAGDEWRAEIEGALARSRLAILLISPDFLASAFVRDVEVPRLLTDAANGKCRLLCLHARHSAVDQATFDAVGEARRLTDFQSLNDPKTPLSDLPEKDHDRALAEVVRRIAAHWTEAAARS